MIKLVILGIAAILLASRTQAVLRGKFAWEDEVFFMIALYERVGGDGKITCGGVVIDHKWVLTSASCAQNPVGMEAVGGMYFTTSITSKKWQRRVVDYGIVHENYVVGEPHDDIALLHVSEPYEWTEFVRPPTLPTSGEIPSGDVHFFGYGQVTIGYPTTSPALEIKRMDVPIIDWNECRQLVPQDLVLDERMVCTEQIPRQSLCGGDEGGPLVIQHENKEALLVGVASWYYAPCGYKSYPNVYTQVSLYLDWIQKNMNAK